MSKLAAKKTLAAITAAAEVSLFDLSCLIGEVARFAVWEDHGEDYDLAVETFLSLKRQIDADPEAAALVRRSELRERSRIQAIGLKLETKRMIAEAKAAEAESHDGGPEPQDHGTFVVRI